MIDRLEILRAIFPARWHRRKGQPVAPPAMRQLVRRWNALGETHPELVRDLVALGRVTTPQPFDMVDGIPEPAAVDPQVLAYEAGRRDLALQLVALMNLSIFELNALTEDDTDA